MNSYFTLAVPSSVGLPSTPTLTCTQACSTSDITLMWDSSTRLITFQGVVKSEGKYIMAPGPLQFQLAGFTNPATSANAYFKWTSYAVLSTGSYMIDQISSMYIQAQQGLCNINSFVPTDGNYRIYGVAKNWTVSM